MRIFLELIWSFIQVGLFSIGGGYAALPLIQAQVVDKYHWLTLSEFTDIVTISQMTPGPIAINSATFIGTKVAGLPGAVTATIAVVLPSFIIVITLAHVYYKYRQLDMMKGTLAALRPAIVALIASAGISLLIEAVWKSKEFITIENTDWLAVGLIVGAFVIIRKWKIDPLYLIIGTGILGSIITLLVK